MPRKSRITSGMEPFLEGYREKAQELEEKLAGKVALCCLDILERLFAEKIVNEDDVVKMCTEYNPEYAPDHVTSALKELERRGLVHINGKVVSLKVYIAANA